MRLAKSKGLALPQQEDFSLSEIYCQPPVAGKLNQTRSIGFASIDDE